MHPDRFSSKRLRRAHTLAARRRSLLRLAATSLAALFAGESRAQLALVALDQPRAITFDANLPGVNNWEFNAGHTGGQMAPLPASNALDSDALFFFEFVGNSGMAGLEIDQGGTTSAGLRGIAYSVTHNDNIQGVHANLAAPGNLSRAIIAQGGSSTTLYQLGLHVVNSTGAPLTRLTVQYDAYSRAAGSGSTALSFFHGASQPSVASGAVQDGVNGWSRAGMTVGEPGRNDPALPWSQGSREVVTLDGLSIPVGGSYYLAWEFAVPGGNNTARGALALDNIVVTAGAPERSVFSLIQPDTAHVIDFDTTVPGANNGPFNAGQTGNGWSPFPASQALDSDSLYVFHFAGNSGMDAVEIDLGGFTSGGLRGNNYNASVNTNIQGIHSNLLFEGATSRAFVVQGGSSTGVFQLALRVSNQTGGTIRTLDLSYDAFTRAAGSGTARLRALHHSLRPVAGTGRVQGGVNGWTLAHTTTQTGQNNPALPWSRTPVNLTLTGLNIPPGADYHFVFDFEVPGGNETARGALALDNISLTPGVDFSDPWTGSRPNILVLVTDDHSHPHFGAAGSGPWIHTPAFDRLAHDGVLFTRGYVPTPSCSPTRAAILTGLAPWQLDEGMRHASQLDNRFRLHTYPYLLEQHGYHVGYAHKGWGPGEATEINNPAGLNRYLYRYYENTPKSNNNWDYTREFTQGFLPQRQPGQPFCFWVGFAEPHRPYVTHGDGIAGRDPAAVVVPGFMSDTAQAREELMKYAAEIEWADDHAGRILAHLEQIGELDNTIVILIGDNGMDFQPRAKATLYDYGVHVPFVVHWSALPAASRGRIVDDFVNGIDIAPTLYALAGVTPPFKLPGKNLLPLLVAETEGQVDPDRDHAIFATERHTSNGYPPARGIRKGDYLYIRTWHRETAANPAQSVWGQQLYDLSTDPFCLTNIRTQNAGTLALADQLWSELQARLIEQRDPRMFGLGAAFQAAAEYGTFTVTPEDPAMLAYVDSLLAQDNDGDGFPDGVSIHFGGGPDGTGQSTVVTPALTRVGSEFVIEYRRSPFDHFIGLGIEYSFDSGATWSTTGLTSPEVVDEIQGREVVRVRFPDQGHSTAQIRFSAARRSD